MSASSDEAIRALRENGVFHLRGALTEATLDECRNSATGHFGEVLRALLLNQVLSMRNGGQPAPTRFAEVVERDGGRLDVRHEPSDGTFKPIIASAASSLLGDVLVALLGEDAEVVATGNVVAMCTNGWVEAGLGDKDDEDDEDSMVIMADHLGEQAWHADGPHLFDEVDLPAHALNVFFPLVDLDLQTGPTEFAPGSHVRGHERVAQTDSGEAGDGGGEAGNETPQKTPQKTLSILARAGDAIIFDYRTWHRGLPNSSDHDRQMLYMVVSKPWWTDSRNYRQEKSLLERRAGKADTAATSADGGASSASSSAKRKRPQQPPPPLQPPPQPPQPPLQQRVRLRQPPPSQAVVHVGGAPEPER